MAQPLTRRSPSSESSEERHLRLVRGRPSEAKPKGDPQRRRSPVPIVLLVVLTVFGVVALQAWVGQEGLRAAQLERRVQQEQERLTLLRAQLAELSSAQRLRAEADKLGLVADPDPTFIRAPLGPARAPTAPDATKRLTARSP